MADIPTLEPAQDVALADDADAPAPRKRPWMLILLSTIVVLAATGGAIAWFALGQGSASSAHAEHAPAAKGPALYVALDPPFVTNFETEQLVRFLQVTVQLMTHDAGTADLIKANDPAIRDGLLLLFGNQKYADISTRHGKERLRTQALEAVRHIVAASGGKPERVEAVYFTSFVMQ